MGSGVWSLGSGAAWVVLLVGCGAAPATESTPLPDVPEGVEAISLLGTELARPEIPADRLAEMERQLAAAQAAADRARDNADSTIWLGRRTAYLGRYREAIVIFGRGIDHHPDDARLYRHRGHRWITIRELDRAIEDLERAAELVAGTPDQVEPDGQPNAYGIPTSTLHGNIWYHLALARYLKHDFEGALTAWQEALETTTNDDMLVAVSDWLYMTLRRLARHEEAERVLDRIHADMRILENHAYHRRLLMYKDQLSVDDLMPAVEADPVQLATYGYGIGNWHLVNGREQEAFDVFERIIALPNWAAFGYIAAEAELAARARR